MIRICGYILFVLSCWPLQLYAVETPEVPGPRDRAARIVLGPRNLDEFRGLLLEPLADWVGNGRFVARMVSELDFAWEFNSQWKAASTNNRDLLAIGDAGSLLSKDGEPVAKGFPFPDIDSRIEAAEAADEVNDAREQFAYELLWNAAYAESAAGQILYDLDITWVGVQGA